MSRFVCILTVLCARKSQSMLLNDTRLFTRNTRFDNISAAKKAEVLTVFISITSGPGEYGLRQAARETWLLPCTASPYCDYRFFIDHVTNRSNAAFVFTPLFDEIYSDQHDDIVLRDGWCDLMNQHPPHINYGNAMNGRIPHYRGKRLYKIDWKICFMKWSLMQANGDPGKTPYYHVFVEDDSYMCTEHVIYQMDILRKMSQWQDIKPFRTGFPMADGFDDSSTLMSREVAMAFAMNYPHKFNCSHLADQDKGFISWGNSWMEANCGWRDQLHMFLNLSMNIPLPSCNTYVYHNNKNYRLPGVPHNPSDTDLPEDFPCNGLSIIIHHPIVYAITVGHPLVPRMCEYMMLLDKVKIPEEMYALWNVGTEHNYHNLSVVFTNEYIQGWIKLLLEYTKDEKEHCTTATTTANATVSTRLHNCTVAWRRRRARRALRNIDDIKGLYDMENSVRFNPLDNDNNEEDVGEGGGGGGDVGRISISSWLDYVQRTSGTLAE